MTKINDYGMPKYIHCPSCGEEKKHHMIDYKYVIEASFIPGSRAIRIDMTYICDGCRAIHHEYDTYLMGEGESANEFENKINENMDKNW